MKTTDSFWILPPTLVLSGVLAVVAPSKPARAEPQGGLDLTWDAPPGCPSRDVVRERVRALVGASADKATRLQARGEIVRNDRRYRLTLKVREDGADAERVIESDSCADLAGAAAVALGLLMGAKIEADGAEVNEPAASATGKTDEPAPDLGSTPTPRPPPTAGVNAGTGRSDAAASPDEPRASAPRSSWLLLRAPLAGIDFGPLPASSPNLGLAAGVRADAFELTLGARLSVGQTRSGSGPPAFGAKLARATAELRTCYAFGRDSLAVGPCLLVALDRISASGEGDQVISRTAHAFAFAVGAGGLARLKLSDSLALIVLLGAEVQASRTRIVVEGLGEVAQLAPFVFSTSAGLEWTF